MDSESLIIREIGVVYSFRGALLCSSGADSIDDDIFGRVQCAITHLVFLVGSRFCDYSCNKFGPAWNSYKLYFDDKFHNASDAVIFDFCDWLSSLCGAVQIIYLHDVRRSSYG